MEHDDLDKRFRDLIQGDDSYLNEQERNTKEAIWNQIDKPQKEKRIFPFWQIAAAALLLLLIGTSWLFSNKIKNQNLHFSALQKELLETKNSLETVQQEFTKLELTTNNKLKNNTLSKVNQAKEVVEVLKTEYVENVIYIRDTLFLEKNILPQERIKLIRDTVFIEVPAKQAKRFAGLDTKEETSKEKSSVSDPSKRLIKNKSQKIEFVFGKKTLDKPGQKSPYFLINETELAKKTDKDNKSNLFIIPINNN